MLWTRGVSISYPWFAGLRMGIATGPTLHQLIPCTLVALRNGPATSRTSGGGDCTAARRPRRQQAEIPTLSTCNSGFLTLPRGWQSAVKMGLTEHRHPRRTRAPLFSQTTAKQAAKIRTGMCCLSTDRCEGLMILAVDAGHLGGLAIDMSSGTRGVQCADEVSCPIEGTCASLWQTQCNTWGQCADGAYISVLADDGRGCYAKGQLLDCQVAALSFPSLAESCKCCKTFHLSTCWPGSVR
jgi:hypothetical protein